MSDTDTSDSATERLEQLQNSLDEQMSSRRGVLGGAAAVGGLLAFGPMSTGATMADPDEIVPQAENDSTSNIDVLNYALTLEHLEHTFYHKGMEQFSEKELMTADVVCDRICTEQRKQIPNYLDTVATHEHEHVDKLTAVIKKLGGDPVQQAQYDFGYDSASEFLTTARTLENTGVAAYAGAAPALSKDTLLTAALSIHSVEARHAAILNELTGKSPFPSAFDEPKDMQTVKNAISNFIVSQ